MRAEDDAVASDSEEEGVIAQFVAGVEASGQIIDETYRLAVVDLEWERIRAVDILAVRVFTLERASMCQSGSAHLPWLFAGSSFIFAIGWRNFARIRLPLRLRSGSHERGGDVWPPRRFCGP